MEVASMIEFLRISTPISRWIYSTYCMTGQTPATPFFGANANPKKEMREYCR
jgi:hypothetical protein